MRKGDIKEMTFSKQLEDIEGLHGIGYGNFNIKLETALEDHIKIRHVIGKIDEMAGLGNYGEPWQFIYIFKEICDYLSVRNIGYDISFKWTKENSLIFNLKCLLLMIVNWGVLKTYRQGRLWR